jgi:hypothetical protein
MAFGVAVAIAGGCVAASAFVRHPWRLALAGLTGMLCVGLVALP